MRKSRKQRTVELLRVLEQGPSFGTGERFTKEEYRLWVTTWVIPQLCQSRDNSALIPEAKNVTSYSCLTSAPVAESLLKKQAGEVYEH